MQSIFRIQLLNFFILAMLNRFATKQQLNCEMDYTYLVSILHSQPKETLLNLYYKLL